MASRLCIGLMGFVLLAGTCFAQDDLAKQRCPKPKRFALVFSFGYAGDSMPKDEAKFDELLGKIKEAGFNTIHCTYTEKRLELCKKHDLQMMVHLLADEHHVYKSEDKARAVCEKLKNNEAVWGYNIWNDIYGKTTPGRIRDINSVRTWDPTHPAYSGTYRTSGMRSLNNPDIFGYYDFHWDRGIDLHFPHLLAYSGWAKERNAWFYSWLAVQPGIPGKGNVNRSLWSANTAIACGQKGILWFLATKMMDQKTLEWTQTGKDIAVVNKSIAPLAEALVELGQPLAIHSTTITKTCNNDALPAAKMPPGLEKNAIPDDAWLQVSDGECLIGVYQDSKKRDAVYLANHNAYTEQKLTLRLHSDRGTASRLDRASAKWAPLKIESATINMTLPAGGGELVRFEK